MLGSTSLSFVDMWLALTRRGEHAYSVILWQIRVPRALSAIFVGMALGMSGAALQGLLRNPLADPGVLGVSSVAALGASLTLYYGLITHADTAVMIGAILGALLATCFITLIAMRTRSIATLILIGVGLSSFSGALLLLLLNLAPNPFALSDLLNWTLGSVAGRNLKDIALLAPFMGVGMLMLYQGRKGLNLLVLGEDTAQSLGLSLPIQNTLIIIGSGLAVGASVALAGAIGFVGLVAPHIIRIFYGHDPARALLPSALLAGLILLLADMCIRVIPSPFELKLGVFAALIGGPVFIWIAIRSATSTHCP